MHATAPLTIAIALTAGLFLPLLVFRAKRRFVVDERCSARTGDEIFVALVPARAEEARAVLAACGWEPVSS